MGQSLGQYLQQARTAKGYSIADIGVMTCIGCQYLSALEADDLRKLPAHTITKSYVRSYARAIGLDEAEVMTRFAEAAGAYYPQQEATQQAKVFQDEHRLKSRFEEFIAGLKSLY